MNGSFLWVRFSGSPHAEDLLRGRYDPRTCSFATTTCFRFIFVPPSIASYWRFCVLEALDDRYLFFGTLGGYCGSTPAAASPISRSTLRGRTSNTSAPFRSPSRSRAGAPCPRRPLSIRDENPHDVRAVLDFWKTGQRRATPFDFGSPHGAPIKRAFGSSGHLFRLEKALGVSQGLGATHGSPSSSSAPNTAGCCQWTETTSGDTRTRRSHIGLQICGACWYLTCCRVPGNA